MASPLHPGMQVKAELSLQVPLNHTTTTVLWAQSSYSMATCEPLLMTLLGIEVAFTIHVKGVLTGGQQLQIDLPITMSNWTRSAFFNGFLPVIIMSDCFLGPSRWTP